MSSELGQGGNGGPPGSHLPGLLLGGFESEIILGGGYAPGRGEDTQSNPPCSAAEAGAAPGAAGFSGPLPFPVPRRPRYLRSAGRWAGRAQQCRSAPRCRSAPLCPPGPGPAVLWPGKLRAPSPGGPGPASPPPSLPAFSRRCEPSRHWGARDGRYRAGVGGVLLQIRDWSPTPSSSRKTPVAPTLRWHHAQSGHTSPGK